MYIKFSALIIVIFINSCKINTNDNLIRKIEIKNTTVTTKIELSDLGVIDINYIPLETKPGSLIEKIIKILYDGEDFYIQTYKGVIKFNPSGKFSSSIEREGKGPHEYLDCSDFSVNTKNKTIFILSAMLDKIFVYNHHGYFLKTFDTPIETTNITCFESGLLCYSYNPNGNLENSFDIIDYEGKHIKAFPNKYKFTYTPNGVLFLNEFLFYKMNNDLYIKEMCSDTIFSFSDMQFTPKMILDRGGKTIEVTAKEEIKSINDLSNIKSKYIIDYELLEFGSYLYTIFAYNNQYYIHISCLNDKIQYLLKAEDGIINNIDGGLSFYPKITLNNNSILGWVSPLDLKTHIHSKAFKSSTPLYPEKKKELIQLANTLNENDNPVLMIVKLKD